MTHTTENKKELLRILTPSEESSIPIEELPPAIRPIAVPRLRANIAAGLNRLPLNHRMIVLEPRRFFFPSDFVQRDTLTVIFTLERFSRVQSVKVPNYTRYGEYKERMPLRFASYTSFTCLHRLGDSARRLHEQTGGSFRYLKEMNLLAEALGGTADWTELDRSRKQDFNNAAIFSRGVDTAAGRLGLLIDPREAASDLFAKWLLTGKIAYIPACSENEKEVEARIRYKAYLEILFPEYIAVLAGATTLITPTNWSHTLYLNILAKRDSTEVR